MMKMYLGFLGLFLVGVCGCGGGDPASDPAAVSKCTAWTAAFCDRAVACGSTTRETCLSAASSQVDCGKAAGVSASYDRCMMELPTFDCAVFDGGSTLPASCHAVILVTK